MRAVWSSIRSADRVRHWLRRGNFGVISSASNLIASITQSHHNAFSGRWRDHTASLGGRISPRCLFCSRYYCPPTMDLRKQRSVNREKRDLKVIFTPEDAPSDPTVTDGFPAAALPAFATHRKCEPDTRR